MIAGESQEDMEYFTDKEWAKLEASNARKAAASK
jgi:hypothetical protein